MQHCRLRLSQSFPASRRGIVLVLAAMLLVFTFLFAAVVVDFGYLSLTVSQAQNCADAAAHAAAAELYPSPLPQTAIKLPIALPIYRPVIPTANVSPASVSAHAIAGTNRVADTLHPILLNSDVSFGVWDNGVMIGPPATVALVDDLLEGLDLRTSDHAFANSVTVTVRRDARANGMLNLFFAPVIGTRMRGVHASSTAAILRGYGAEAGDKLLPFAMDITVWNAIRFTNGEVNAVNLTPLGVNLDSLSLNYLLGQNPLLSFINDQTPLDLLGNPIEVLDNAKWSRPMTTIAEGADEIWEAVLVADQFQSIKLLGLLGNVLTTVKHVPATFVALDYRVNAGSSPDATYMNRVLQEGIDSLDVQNTSTTDDQRVWLPFRARGYFEVPTGCEADLKALIGKPRIMPLYGTIPGTVVNKVTDLLGLQHRFKIVGWAAVVITKVNLTGPIRYINIQPAIYTSGTIHPATGLQRSVINSTFSDGVYTNSRIVY